MKIAEDLYYRMVWHAIADLPNECCGLVACENGDAVAVHPCKNINGSSASFEMDPVEQVSLIEAIRADGLRVGAIYHSHPGLDPAPSGIDVRYAQAWPGITWIIVGHRWGRLASKGVAQWGKPGAWFEPDVWAWRIEGSRVFTADLTVA